MERNDLDPKAITEAADVAADYDGLQGLTGAFQGVVLVVMGLSGNVLWGSVLLAFSVVFGQWYYHKRYGRASTKPRDLGLQLLVGLPCVLLVVAALVADRFLAGPISLGALAGALALAGISRVSLRHVGPTKVHWMTIGALALSSLVPLIAAPATLWHYSIIVIGLAMAVIGLVDHRRLTRALGARSATSEEDADE